MGNCIFKLTLREFPCEKQNCEFLSNTIQQIRMKVTQFSNLATCNQKTMVESFWIIMAVFVLNADLRIHNKCSRSESLLQVEECTKAQDEVGN